MRIRVEADWATPSITELQQDPTEILNKTKELEAAVDELSTATTDMSFVTDMIKGK